MIKSFLSRPAMCVQVLALAAISPAFADDELAVYTFNNRQPGVGLTLVLDGQETTTVGKDGSAFFDLSEGVHSLQVRDGEQSLYSFRFTTARGQQVDALITLGDDTTHRVETYSPAESAEDKRDAPTGSLSGTVSAAAGGLAGASIVVEDTGELLLADADGRFNVTLPRGEYRLTAYHPTDDRTASRTVRVVSGVTRGVGLTIRNQSALDVEAPTLSGIEEVVVVAAFDPNAFEASERDTNQIIDTLDIETLSRFADTNVAASVVRVPSVTVQDNRFVFIRGLGDRYISTTLNGATMPSTDPAKRTVPLDLFPSNFVNQLDIRKTFIPGMPGESTGGNLVINTRTFPTERSGQLQVRMSATPGVTGNDVFADPTDGDFDYFGWDAGAREAPVAVEAITQALNIGTVTDSNTGGIFQINDTVERELRRVGGLLISDNLDLELTNAAPDTRIGANYGDVFDIGNVELGIFAAGNFSNQWSQRNDGVSNTFTPSGDDLNRFRFQEYTNSIDANALLSVGLNVGQHTIELNSIASRATESRVVRTVGQEGDEFQARYRNTVDWVERQFLSQQIAGNHSLVESGSVYLDWQFTASQARRDAPDRREITFSADQFQTDPQSLLDGFDLDRLNDDQDVELNGFFLESNALVRRYDELTDNNFDFSTSLGWDLIDNGNSFANLQIGGQIIYRERDSDSDTYGFNLNQQNVENLITDEILVSDIITEETITGDPATGFTFLDRTLASDSYDAELDYNSIFATYDHTFNDRFQVVIGARYEMYDQTTNTFSLQGAGEAVQSRIDEGSFLPSFSLNWFATEAHQFRFAISQTVARPDFKESANATFYDTEFDFRVRGNPNLEISDVLNVDARWEWYPNDRDSLSVAAFYKDFDNPIERVVQQASGTAGNSRTFANAESAFLYGAEVEARKEFLISDDYARSFFLALNASYIESEVQLPTRTRALQGQPQYTSNLVLGFDHAGYGQQVTILINQNGEAIRDVGILGNPDVIEEPRLDINLVYRWDISDSFTFRAKASNLLDDEVEFTQGGRTFFAYKRGVEFQLGADWNF
ncbi:MAG: TonB-dependent receptor [Pseudomonadota bacterium]